MREQSYIKNNSQPNNSRGGETKIMKKFINALLAFVLVFAFAMPAMAAPASDVAGTDYEDAVAKLTALGVINGYEDGSYRPDNDITRAEFAKIVVVATGNESAATILKGTSPFSDVAGEAWYSGYVAAASSYGYVKGYSDGTFRPQNNITGQEVVTVLLRALGYSDELPGNWPYDYLIKANDLGLLDDVDFAAAIKANRGLVAQLTAVNLDQNLVTYDADLNVFDTGSELFVEGINAAGFETAVVTAPELDEDGQIELGTTFTAIAEDAYVGTWSIGEYVNYLLNADGEVTYLAPATNYVVTGTLDDTNSLVIDDETYDFTGATFFYNNKVQADASKLVEDVDVTVYLTAADALTARFVVAEGFDVKSKIVDSVTINSRYQLIVFEDASSIKVSLDLDVSDIEAGSVVYASYPGGDNTEDAYKVLVVTDEVTGTVTKKAGSDYTIGGTVYTDVSGDLDGTSLGKTYTLTLNNEGEIVKAVEVVDETTTTTFDGYLGAFDEYTTLDADGKIISVADVTVYTLKGEEVKYRTDLVDGADALTDLAGEITALALTPANTIYTFTVSEDGELVMTGADAPAALTLTSVATPVAIDTDGISGSLVTAGSVSYYVTADTVVVFTTYNAGAIEVDDADESSVKTLADLEDGMEFAYKATGVNFDYLVVTNSAPTPTSADDVVGFFVEGTTEVVWNAEDEVTETVYTLTLNVDGVDAVYTVESDLSVGRTEGDFVTLSDSVTVDEKYDAVAFSALADVTTLTTDADNNTFTVNAANYIVTADTQIFVKTQDDDLDPVYLVGTYSDIVNSANGLVVADTYKYVVLDSSVTIGGFTVADVIVIQDLN